jgi:hypothetical protein
VGVRLQPPCVPVAGSATGTVGTTGHVNECASAAGRSQYSSGASEAVEAFLDEARGGEVTPLTTRKRTGLATVYRTAPVGPPPFRGQLRSAASIAKADSTNANETESAGNARTLEATPRSAGTAEAISISHLSSSACNLIADCPSLVSLLGSTATNWTQARRGRGRPSACAISCWLMKTTSHEGIRSVLGQRDGRICNRAMSLSLEPCQAGRK